MLKPFFRFHSVLISALIFVAGQAYAYAPTDVATVTLAPDASWKVVANVMQDDPNTVTYQKITPLSPAELKSVLALPKPHGRNAPPPATEIIETLSQRSQPIPIHVASTDFIKQMAQILSSGLTSKGCLVGVPFAEPQSNGRFTLMAQVFQCQKSQLTGIQYYIDADPKNIYLMTYTNTQYPFTGESRKAAEGQIKSAMKICYQDQCYPVQ
jgi:hypothetical protein